MLKAIVFDFGNVLYDLNEKLFMENLAALLGEDVTETYPPQLMDAFFDYEVGKISTETFIWRVQHYKKGNLNPRSIINCWNSLLDKFPPQRWDLLESVRSEYKVFMLSNINELHLNTAYKHISKVHGRIDFETEYFDGVFYSHLVKKRKPEKEIYTFLEEVTGIKGHELLFIDDRLENIKTAQSLNWNAVHHNPKDDIAAVFPDYIKKYKL